MWELDCKESWMPKNWCFWTVVLEKTLESLLDCKDFQPVNPKGDQSCIFIGRTDVEAETPILWPPDVKNWLIWKDLDIGKDWRQEEKGTREDEMVGWHHQLDGHEFERALGVGNEQGSLVCYSPQGHKESNMTEQLKWTESKNWIFFLKYLNIWLLSVCDTSSLVFFFLNKKVLAFKNIKYLAEIHMHFVPYLWIATSQK